MNKIIINSTFTLIIFSVIACGNPTDAPKSEDKKPEYTELIKASWLIGTWKNDSMNVHATEIWSIRNDSSYEGKSYIQIGTDTVSTELISLEQRGKELFYIPIVKDQNNNEPVKFVLTSLTSKQLVFENPAHDFPQKISYTQIAADSLLAEISGLQNGKPASEYFPMKRIN